MPPVRPPLTLRDIDFRYYFSHYTNLLWRWKWYLAIAGPLTVFLWSWYVLKNGVIQPELETKVLIGFTDMSRISAVKDPATINYGKLELIRSRNFLPGVVDKLSLRLTTPKDQRQTIFRMVAVDGAARSGNYRLALDSGGTKAFTVTFSDRPFGYRAETVSSGFLKDTDTLRIPGIRAIFSPAFLAQPHDFVFTVVTSDDAVERLYRSIKINDDTWQSGYAAVSITGRDYGLATETVNTMADDFVSRDVGVRREKTNEVLAILEKQMATAAGQHDNTERNLRDFRTSHPTVGLNEETAHSINDLAALSKADIEDSIAIRQAAALRSDFLRAGPDDKELAARQAVLFLARDGQAAASAIENELTQALHDQKELVRNYAPTHPLVRENEQKVIDLTKKVQDLLDGFAESKKQDLERRASDIRQISTTFERLPSWEMRRAELERQLQISSGIHSAILSSYNQAKISDATQISDIYVLDYAVPPRPPSDLVRLLTLLGLGVVCGLAVAFGPVLLFDLSDRTVRTKEELRRLVNLPVLESIPVVKIPKKPKLPKAAAGAAPVADKKLVTVDYAPDFVNELFRYLRSKILFGLNGNGHRGLVVTGLGEADGKSFIAANIAVTMAQQKLKTILVDGDLRRGVLHELFNVKQSPGLSTLLNNDGPSLPEGWERAVRATSVPNLNLLSVGEYLPNPLELLSSAQMAHLVEQLFRSCDVLIIDTPPIGLCADAATLKHLVPYYLLVVRAGATNIIELQRRVDEIPALREKVLGIVLNQAMVDRRLKAYSYSRYHY